MASDYVKEHPEYVRAVMSDHINSEVSELMRTGRIKSLRHKDIVEVEWVDTAGSSGWSDKVSDPVRVTTVGYYNQIKKSDKYGPFLSLYPSMDEIGKLTDSIAIPEVNIVSIRRVSKGVK